MQTPEEHLKDHPLAVGLRRLGVTDSQLGAMKFRANNEGLPFDQWSFHFLEDMPHKAVNLVKSYCALKWLILENPPPSRDKEDAWQLVSDVMAAPIFQTGIKHKEAQRERARKPRGKIADGEITINQLIGQLALNEEYRPQSAKELWPRFYAMLDEEALNPGEKKSPAGIEMDLYEYEVEGKRKSITYGRFANVVSQARKKSR